jgi:hypothetical protein
MSQILFNSKIENKDFTSEILGFKEFEKCAANRTALGTISKENGATITRMGMSGKMETVEANAGDKVYKGDIIKTPPNGSVVIALPDKTVVSADQNSAIDIAKFEVAARQDAGDNSEVKRGTLSAASGAPAKASPEPVSFASPGAMAIGVRG